jgi:putative ABC transport system permease protein
MLQDFRFAVRSLLASRGFTSAAVLTLALGMGATTVVYGIVDALLLRPEPFGPRSARLVTLHSTHPTQAQDWDDSEMSYADLIDVGEASTTLEAVGGVATRNLSLAADTEAERVRGASVTPNLFDLLQTQPQIGRAFNEDEGALPGFETVAIISDALWRRMYGSDRAVEGRPILVNGRSLTVIGVMPPRFAFPEQTDVWLPYRRPREQARDSRGMLAIGLLEDGATIDAARADARGIAARLEARYPETNRGWGIHLMPLREFFVGGAMRRAITSMLAAVALVLLVGCANVASLLVARGIARQRELTLRAALGAGRFRLVRLLLVESLLLAVVAGGAGLLLASWGLDALLASNPEPPPYWAHVRIDGRVVLFMAGLSAVTAILCGLIPALRISRIQISSGALQAGRAAGGAKGERRVQGMLVATQVAVSFALLVGATLLARSTAALQNADIGFDATGMLSLRFYIAGDAYDPPAARARVVANIVERVQALPGVASAAATGAIPGDDGGTTLRLVPERGAAVQGEEIGAQSIPITAALYDTLGLRLIEGRTFSASEIANPESDAAIVNSRLARTFWPGETAVGRVLRVADRDQIVTLRVIGVVPDVVYEELGEETAQSRLNVYIPYARAGWRGMALLVRASGDPDSLAPAARRAIHDVDRGFAAFDVMAMTDRRAFTMWGERFIGRTFGAFALAALLLACIGAYGLTAYAALQRSREIGVRIAVGATRQDIVRLLLARDGRLALAGMAVGLPVAIGSAAVLEKLLFQVSPWNPAVWIVTPVALFAAILTASFLPARRASRTDPAITLRAE